MAEANLNYSTFNLVFLEGKSVQDSIVLSAFVSTRWFCNLVQECFSTPHDLDSPSSIGQGASAPPHSWEGLHRLIFWACLICAHWLCKYFFLLLITIIEPVLETTVHCH